MAAALAFDEPARLQRLQALGILDQPEDPHLAALTARAVAAFEGASMGAVSLVDKARQCFVAGVGLPVVQTPREHSFCAHVILGSRTMVIVDAMRDRRFASNPLVTGPPDIRFYAGAPLLGGIGTLCVMGTAPRRPSEGEMKALELLARFVDAQLLLVGSLKSLRQGAG